MNPHHHRTATAHRTIAGLYGVGLVLGLLLAIALVDDGGYVLAGVLALFLLPVVVLHLVVAHGAARCRPWARVASIVLGVLLLTGFPIGTLLGIWLLVNAIPEWREERQRAVSPADGWPQPQPQPPPLP